MRWSWLPLHGRHHPRDRRRARRRKTHRAYGLPNANQILLATIVVALLFVQLLVPKWSNLASSHVTAGLSGVQVTAENGTTTRLAWAEYCAGGVHVDVHVDATNIGAANIDAQNRSSIVEEEPTIAVPTETERALQMMCDSQVPMQVRGLTAVSIALAMLSVALALYLHLGSPSQQQVERFGVIPAVLLLITAILATASLVFWQRRFSELDKGDCFGVAIASAVIAYLVAFAVAVRWRWPGIFAVENEQQAFDARVHRFSVLAATSRGRTTHESAPREDAPFQAIA